MRYLFKGKSGLMHAVELAANDHLPARTACGHAADVRRARLAMGRPANCLWCLASVKRWEGHRGR